jgi:3-(3-hydroxy-phenyl)propionate hydroxylase
VVLVRPDAVVAARWHRFDADAVRRAWARAFGRSNG